ncbi:hypothetical protein QL285_052557 [Trifolium repens]|nr:hypothetical protein QL285_052557 [Trifolium repens]
MDCNVLPFCKDSISTFFLEISIACVFILSNTTLGTTGKPWGEVLRSPASTCGRPARSCGRPARSCGRPVRSCGRPARSCGRPARSCGQPAVVCSKVLPPLGNPFQALCTIGVQVMSYCWKVRGCCCICVELQSPGQFCMNSLQRVVGERSWRAGFWADETCHGELLLATAS